MKFTILGIVTDPTTSLPARGVWIEISRVGQLYHLAGSLPARGVWIEMLHLYNRRNYKMVTPRKGSVD